MAFAAVQCLSRPHFGLTLTKSWFFVSSQRLLGARFFVSSHGCRAPGYCFATAVLGAWFMNSPQWMGARFLVSPNDLGRQLFLFTTPARGTSTLLHNHAYPSLPHHTPRPHNPLHPHHPAHSSTLSTGVHPHTFAHLDTPLQTYIFFSLVWFFRCRSGFGCGLVKL